VTRGFRGVNGARVREADEGHTREITARYTGLCADTGMAIKPGDLISYDRTTKRTVLLQAADTSRYISDVIRTSGGTFYRNKQGRCEDAPCCGCCTI
jgi:hypothetical protein